MTYREIEHVLRQVLETTWESLPRDVQRLLYGRWGYRVADLGHGADGCETWAEVGGNGAIVAFDRSVLERFAQDPALLEDLAAHELAHIVRNLRGVASADEATEEREATKLARSWGFRLHRLQKTASAKGRVCQCPRP